MSYQIRWNDDSQTIVRQIYEGSVGRADFEAMISASYRLLQTVTHRVDVIVEWRGERRSLNDMTLVYGTVFAEKRAACNQRFVFLIDAPVMLRMMAKALQRAAPRAFGSLYFVETVEAAFRLRTILLDSETSSV